MLVRTASKTKLSQEVVEAKAVVWLESPTDTDEDETDKGHWYKRDICQLVEVRTAVQYLTCGSGAKYRRWWSTELLAITPTISSCPRRRSRIRSIRLICNLLLLEEPINAFGAKCCFVQSRPWNCKREADSSICPATHRTLGSEQWVDSSTNRWGHTFRSLAYHPRQTPCWQIHGRLAKWKKIWKIRSQLYNVKDVANSPKPGPNAHAEMSRPHRQRLRPRPLHLTPSRTLPLALPLCIRQKFRRLLPQLVTMVVWQLVSGEAASESFKEPPTLLELIPLFTPFAGLAAQAKLHSPGTHADCFPSRLMLDSRMSSTSRLTSCSTAVRVMTTMLPSRLWKQQGSWRDRYATVRLIWLTWSVFFTFYWLLNRFAKKKSIGKIQ